MISLMGLLLASGPALAQTPTVIEGWGPLKFGMSIADAKAASDIAWSPRTCTDQQEIALKGCTLWADFDLKYGTNRESDYYKVTIDGMRFQPQLTFDRWGRLETIRLDLRENADIQACQTYFQRTMDNLERRYGRFTSTQYQLSNELADTGWTKQDHTTPAGSLYSVSVDKNRSTSMSSRIATDLAALEESIKLSREMSLRRASRPFLVAEFYTSVLTKPELRNNCSINIRYEAADMPAPQAAGGNKIDF